MKFFLVSILPVVPATIAAIAALISSLRTHRAVNGLVADRVHAAKAEGRQDERDEQANGKRVP